MERYCFLWFFSGILLVLLKYLFGSLLLLLLSYFPGVLVIALPIDNTYDALQVVERDINNIHHDTLQRFGWSAPQVTSDTFLGQVLLRPPLFDGDQSVNAVSHTLPHSLPARPRPRWV